MIEIAKMENEIIEAVDQVLIRHGQQHSPIFLITISHDEAFNYATRSTNNLDKMDLSQARLMATKLHAAATSIEHSVENNQIITATNDELAPTPSKEARS